MTDESNGKYTRNAPMIDGTQESYERIIDKLEKENAELKLSQGRLECRVIETQEFGLAEIKKLKEKNRQLTDDKIDSVLRIEQLIDDVEGLEKQIADLKKEKPKTDEAFNSLVSRWIKDHKYYRNKIKGLEAELILALHSSVKLSKKCSRIQDIIKEKI